MGKLNLKDRIDNSIKAKKEIVKKKDVFLNKIEFDSKKEYTEDIKLNNYLNAKSNLVKQVQVTTSIFLGETFEEVRKKIGSNYRGLYVEWLEDNGYNKMTALRHRNRYNLFKICKTNEGKLLVAGLSQDVIQKIASMKDEDEERAEILRAIDRGADKEEIENILNIKEESKGDKCIEVKESLKISDLLNIEKIKGITKYDNLQVYKQKIKKLKGDLEKIEVVLKDKEVELYNEDKAGVSRSQ